MSAPLSHTEITKALKRLAFLANDLDAAYRWGHMLGHQRRSAGDAVNVTTSGTSDPTLSTIEDQVAKRIRENMGEASSEILKASRAMELALSAIGRAFATANAGQKLSADGEPVGFEPIRKSELRVAEKAAARRKGRGEGWGEG